MARLPASSSSLLLTLSACTPLAPVPAPTDRPVERIVFLGDSLVRRSDSDHGLLTLVLDHLRRRHADRAFQLVAAGAYVIASGHTLIGERPPGQNEKDA